MSAVERFPRGGYTASKVSSSDSEKKQHILKHLQDLRNAKQCNDDNIQSIRIPGSKKAGVIDETAENLEFTDIHEGMCILACVKAIRAENISVQFPGRNFGFITIKNISTPYSKLLAKAAEGINKMENYPSFERIFTNGQFLPVKVYDMDQGHIHVSCNPKDINSSMHHTHFTHGRLVWGAIAGQSANGYEVDLGVENLQAHLRFEYAEDQYSIGQVLYAVVMKVNSSLEASTISLSSLKTDIEETVERSIISLDLTLPGMQVEFVVQGHVENGLQGTFFMERGGFINHMHLKRDTHKPGEYCKQQVLNVRLMYVKPFSKQAYFTLYSVTDELPGRMLKIGSSQKATVKYTDMSGVILKLPFEHNACIPCKPLKFVNNCQRPVVSPTESIEEAYPEGKTVNCKIVYYYYPGRMYLCVFDNNTNIMDGMYLGQVVEGLVESITKHGLDVNVGKLRAFVPKQHLPNYHVDNCDTITSSFKPGQQVMGKVWKMGHNMMITLKPEFLASDVHLTSFENINKKAKYPGLVISTSPNGALLMFYGNLKAFLPMRNIPQSSENGINEYHVGQVIKTRVLNSDGSKITLTKRSLSAYHILPGTRVRNPIIFAIAEDGLRVHVKRTEAFIPSEQIAYEGLGKSMLGMFKVGDVFQSELMCLLDSNPPVLSAIESRAFRREALQIPDRKDLTHGIVLRAVIGGENSIIVPLRNYYLPLNNDDENLEDQKQYQSVSVRVITTKTNYLRFSSFLDDVFDFNYRETLKYLDDFFADYELLARMFAETNTASNLTQLRIGALVKCRIKSVSALNECVMVLNPSGVVGFSPPYLFRDGVEIGDDVNGRVLWLDYRKNQAIVALKSKIIKAFNEEEDEGVSLHKLKTTARILYANKHFAMGVLPKRCGQKLIYLPVKLHQNDFGPRKELYNEMLLRKVCTTTFKMRSGRVLGITQIMLKLMHDKHTLYPRITKLTTKSINAEQRQGNNLDQSDQPDIKVEDETPKEEPEIEIKSENTYNGEAGPRKRKASPVEPELEIANERFEIGCSDQEGSQSKRKSVKKQNNFDKFNETEDPTKNMLEADSGEKPTRKKRKSSAVEPKSRKKASISEVKQIAPALPDMRSFFEEAQPPTTIALPEDGNERTPQIKRKLTPAAKAQKAKEEEARLRKIETELADTSILPQNAEQFDRALMGNPDDSELWTQYIAFHMQSTEFEKARGVARRALERISFSALQDRFNVWLALLNLENMYGTKESFDKVFEEAARCNDALMIYLEAIKILGDASKYPEMEEKIKKAKAKFKQDVEMWLSVGKVYYQAGRLADARKMKDSALLTLQDKKTHLYLIVQYAIMEFNFGEENHGEALFETILQADPKRVNVWSTYVDQLVKRNKIDIARNVLQRAVGQKLAYKKMKALFKKYHAFEQSFGDEESQRHVTKLLQEFCE